MKKGFTLAEVLITLVVIGVIAAITIPVIIADTQKQELETARLKAMSTIANGYKRMMAINQVTDIRNLPMFNCGNAQCFAAEHYHVFNIISDSLSDTVVTDFNNEPMYGAAYALTFEKEYKRKDLEPINVNWGDLEYAFITGDGMIFGLTNIDTESRSYFDILVDTNCGKNPNTVQKDYFEFQFADSGQLVDVTEDALNYNEDEDTGDTTSTPSEDTPTQTPSVDNNTDTPNIENPNNNKWKPRRNKNKHRGKRDKNQRDPNWKDKHKDNHKEDNPNKGPENNNGGGYGSNNGHGNGSDNTNGNGGGNNSSIFDDDKDRPGNSGENSNGGNSGVIGGGGGGDFYIPELEEEEDDEKDKDKDKNNNGNNGNGNNK